MKHFLKTHVRRVTAALLTVLMCLTAFPFSAAAMTVSEGKTVSAYYGSNYVGSDGMTYDNYPMQYIVYNGNGGTSTRYSDITGPRVKLMISDYTGSRQVMCIESGVDYNAGGSYRSESGTNSSYFQSLPATARYGIMLTSIYGWAPGKAVPVSGCNEDDYSVATQIIMWEYQQQLRTSPTSISSNSYGIPANTYSKTIQGRPAAKCYNWILQQMATHATVPSFASNSRLNAPTHTMKYDKASGTYSITLADTNNTLADLVFQASNGVTVTRSGNQYTFTSKNKLTSPVTLTAQKRVSLIGGDLFIWGAPGYQTMMSGAEDPVLFYIKLVTESDGSIRIVKTSEDGKVDGIQIRITGDGVDTTVTTNHGGEIEVPNLHAGTYTVTELPADWYEPQTSQKVTVSPDETATVSFANKLKRGSLTVTKTAEDGLAQGSRFRLHGTSLSGAKVDEYATVGADGKAYFKNILIGTGYTLEEVDTPDRYIVPGAQTADIRWNEVTEKTFVNNSKRGSLVVTKNAEDGLSEGMRFHLSGTALSGAKVDEYATVGADGKAYFKNILIGTGYTLEEVDTPDRYIVPDAQTADIRWNEITERTFENNSKRGTLVVTKNAEDGLSEGMRFRLHGTSLSGVMVDEYATVGSDGKAYFRDVLIGEAYTIEEVDTPDRYVVPDAQTAAIRWNEVTEKTFDNDLKRGDLTVTKTAEDGLSEGMRFHLSGTSLSGAAVDEYATVGSDGKAYFRDILIGTGYVLEEVDTPDRYIIPANQTADIEWNTVTEKTFDNRLKRGDLTVTKTAEDGLTEGITFRLSGTSYSGLPVNETATVGKDGKAYFKNILIGSNYVLEEVDTAVRYVVPAKQTQTVEWNKVTQATVQNILKKWNVTVTKRDGETGEAQGDAKLSGAVYGVYKGDELIDAYTTDASGSFTTKYYVCGDDWSIREITPSEGYLLDEDSHHVGAEAKLYTVEYNCTELAVNEQVSKGKIAIIKHTDDGSTQIETPEEGAVFEVYLKRAGSYEAAKETERDTLTCDENGFAESKDLPYGIYTVHQVSGWGGRELMTDFDVFISKDGEVYRYLINNANYESYLKIVKKDAETGKVIPVAGIGFEIYRPDGSKVEMSYTYPTPTTISTFYTNSEGYLVTPEKLEYGKGYALKEVQAPYGYVLNSEPVSFDVVQEDSEVEGSISVIVVELSNKPQKGTISIGKTGEIFSSVTESDGVYQPVYAVQGLPGAVYEITAAEDIVTLDGTVRYTAGELVDTVTTDESGNAKSKALYLGKYTVTETKAPFGCVLNAEPHTVELTYAGQDVELTETATDFVNDRQEVSVSLRKIMEQDKPFGIGRGDEILSVQFGLYASEEIVAADGTLIPKDGLIEIVSVDENGNASIRSDLPFGSFYFKELSTDKHYLLSARKYPFVFEYAGQDVANVEISANEGKGIENKLLRGKIQGLKIDRETEETIAGAVFGLFRRDETEFTEETAILTAESGEDGVFRFEDIPYGSWTIVELTPAEGYLPNTEPHHVHVTTDGEIIEFTVVNDKIPELHTTATTDGGKDAHPSDRLIIEDVVEYTHLVPGKEYKVVGTLMDKATGRPLLVNGQKITAETVFFPEQPSGSVTVTFSFDARGLVMNTDIVVFEHLYKDGKEIAVHADLSDEGQTVHVFVPEIGTTATVDGSHDVCATDVFTLEDTIAYENLIPGREYTVRGTVMDKSTGAPFLVDGEPLTAETTFTAESAAGDVKVTFTFDAKTIHEATDLVVFESLFEGEKELTVHADLEDEGQTVHVHVPEIGTTATVNGSHDVNATEVFTLEDTVAYENLTPGKEYTVKGVLMDKSTGAALVLDGKEITAETTFTPEESAGEVTVAFVFDSRLLDADTDIVVFESLSREDVELAVHADINDDSQTVHVHIPQIGTTATIDGEKDVSATEVFVLEDVVAYENLTPGKEYTVRGTVMDKSTGEVLLLDGKEITAETMFTPEGSSGEVTVTFVFDSRLLDTDTDIVVFESLTREGVEIAVHADLDDGGQTVHVHKPVVKTEATVDGKKEITSDGKITIEDVVSYENLTPGKEYTLYGTLMNKSTGRPFTVNGKAVHAQVKFTPETANGVVSVQFEFLAPTIFETMDVVVFESLRRDGVEVAAHADLSDDGQTVRLTPTPPETPKTGDDRNFPLWWTLSGLCFACSLGCFAFTLWDKFKEKRKEEKANDENKNRPRP